MTSPTPGVVVVLNGVPRAGKSSIAAEIASTFDGDWVVRGVDSMIAATSPELRPGMGLRPGGERPDLEPVVVSSSRELFAALAAFSRSGVNVVADLGIHDGYSQPLNILGEFNQHLAELPVVWVGVHCSLELLRRRRAATNYLTWDPGDKVPAPVLAWQHEVHADKSYDLEVDTSVLTPAECAVQIRRCVRSFLRGS